MRYASSYQREYITVSHWLTLVLPFSKLNDPMRSFKDKIVPSLRFHKKSSQIATTMIELWRDLGAKWPN